MVHFREYAFTEIYRTWATTDTLMSSLLIRYIEGLLYSLVNDIFRKHVVSRQPRNMAGK
jgi:hypothetical protein